MQIREYRAQDFEETKELFQQTVEVINSPDYSPSQIKIWIAAADSNGFQEKLNSSKVFVAEGKDRIIGFISLEGTNHIDCLYTHKDFQGMGVGTALLEEIERHAIRSATSSLVAEVSITARQFFTSRGFKVNKEQTVERSGEYFKNFLMEKSLL